MGKDHISKKEAIKIAKEYLQSREYEYAIDWEHPNARLDRMTLKSDGSLSSGFGKKVWVWSVWFLPVEGIDVKRGVNRVAVDIDAKTGKVYSEYSLN